MADFLRPIIDRLAALEMRLRRVPKLSWATVTTATPLQVRMDGSDAPLAGKPDTIITGLQINDRVLVVRQGSQIIILGRGGG